jgi:VWFA-related protein
MKTMKDWLGKTTKRPSRRAWLHARVFNSLFLLTPLLVAGVFAQRPQTQAPPVFRSGVDLRQIDVTVLDKHRRPVRGLTAADFTLLEDDVSQKIEAFSFVEVTAPVRSEPVWAAKAPADIVTNSLDSARAFVLFIDDGRGMGDLWAKNQMPQSVATFVNQLGPDDTAALVFTARSSDSRGFTRDKASLIRALDDYTSRNDGDHGCTLTARTMLYVSQSLSSMKNRRKAIVYFGGALQFGTSPASDCGIIWAEMVQVANEHNITVYTVDTMGLRPGSQRSNDEYLELAHHTGGTALINNNTFEEGITRIFDENTSYYLLAYQPSKGEDDGRFRRVTVKVNRPDVEVRSARSYWAPRAPTAKRPAPEAPPADAATLAGVLPVAAVPLRATGAPFMGSGGSATVALAVGVQQPPFTERTPETIELLIRRFSPDGMDFGSDRQTIAISVPAARQDASLSRYDVLAKVDVPKPGRYQIRVAAHSDATDTRGSIYVEVDVPDFRNDRVSLSGVVVNAIPATGPVAPVRLLNNLTPLTPTTERAFGTADIVTAFLRVYQGAGEKLASVPLKITIQDAAGKSVFNKTDALAPDRFSADHATDYQFRLPLATLKAGEHLLTFETVVGKTTARRDVRFQVR